MKCSVLLSVFSTAIFCCWVPPAAAATESSSDNLVEDGDYGAQIMELLESIQKVEEMIEKERVLSRRGLRDLGGGSPMGDLGEPSKRTPIKDDPWDSKNTIQLCRKLPDGSHSLFFTISELVLGENPRIQAQIDSGALGVVGNPVFGMPGYIFDKTCQPQSMSFTKPPIWTCPCEDDPTSSPTPSPTPLKPVTCPCLTEEEIDIFTGYGRFLDCETRHCPDALTVGMGNTDSAYVEYFWIELEVSAQSRSCEVRSYPDGLPDGAMCIDIPCPPTISTYVQDLTSEEIDACMEAVATPVGGPSVCSC